jgi:hypothetical protein
VAGGWKFEWWGDPDNPPDHLGVPRLASLRHFDEAFGAAAAFSSYVSKLELEKFKLTLGLILRDRAGARGDMRLQDWFDAEKKRLLAIVRRSSSSSAAGNGQNIEEAANKLFEIARVAAAGLFKQKTTLYDEDKYKDHRARDDDMTITAMVANGVTDEADDADDDLQKLIASWQPEVGEQCHFLGDWDHRRLNASVAHIRKIIRDDETGEVFYTIYHSLNDREIKKIAKRFLQPLAENHIARGSRTRVQVEKFTAEVATSRLGGNNRGGKKKAEESTSSLAQTFSKCRDCQDMKPDDKIILCDGRGCHGDICFSCAVPLGEPPMEVVPSGLWFCWMCQMEVRVEDQHESDEESDDEGTMKEEKKQVEAGTARRSRDASDAADDAMDESAAASTAAARPCVEEEAEGKPKKKRRRESVENKKDEIRRVLGKCKGYIGELEILLSYSFTNDKETHRAENLKYCLKRSRSARRALEALWNLVGGDGELLSRGDVRYFSGTSARLPGKVQGWKQELAALAPNAVEEIEEGAHLIGVVLKDFIDIGPDALPEDEDEDEENEAVQAEKEEDDEEEDESLASTSPAPGAGSFADNAPMYTSNSGVGGSRGAATSASAATSGVAPAAKSKMPVMRKKVSNKEALEAKRAEAKLIDNERAYQLAKSSSLSSSSSSSLSLSSSSSSSSLSSSSSSSSSAFTTLKPKVLARPTFHVPQYQMPPGSVTAGGLGLPGERPNPTKPFFRNDGNLTEPLWDECPHMANHRVRLFQWVMDSFFPIFRNSASEDVIRHDFGKERAKYLAVKLYAHWYFMHTAYPTVFRHPAFPKQSPRHPLHRQHDTLAPMDAEMLAGRILSTSKTVRESGTDHMVASSSAQPQSKLWAEEPREVVGLKERSEFNFSWECMECSAITFISERKCMNPECGATRPSHIPEPHKVLGASYKIAKEWNALIKSANEALHKAPCGRYLPANGDWTDEDVGVQRIRDGYLDRFFLLDGGVDVKCKTLKVRSAIFEHMKAAYLTRQHDPRKVRRCLPRLQRALCALDSQPFCTNIHLFFLIPFCQNS